MSVSPADMVQAAKKRRESTVTHITNVNVTPVIELLEAALDMAEAVEGMRTRIDDTRKHEQQAELGRMLNRLADLATAAGSEAKMEYWRLKGFADPREED